MKWTKNAFAQLADHLNADGQPVERGFRAAAVAARQIDEMIGLVKGVLADGVVCQKETEFLLGWMETNKAVIDQWPANVLYPRILAALEDGHLDPEEEAEIFALLQSAVGNDDAIAQGWSSGSSTLPLTDPAPVVQVTGQTFCFTGKFNSGTRAWCHNQVATLGGIPTTGITKKLDYLVIGDIGSRDWLHSTHGTKILKAVEYRDAGVPLSIISEMHWYQHVVV